MNTGRYQAQPIDLSSEYETMKNLYFKSYFTSKGLLGPNRNDKAFQDENMAKNRAKFTLKLRREKFSVDSKWNAGASSDRSVRLK